MARRTKIAIAVGAAVALHALVLVLAVGPRLHGLPPLDGAEAPEETFAGPSIEEAAIETDEARPVGWGEPAEEAPPKPSLDKIAVAETPAPDAPVKAPPPKPVAKPEPAKPESAAKPVAETKPGAAERKPAADQKAEPKIVVAAATPEAAKPAPKPADQKPAASEARPAPKPSAAAPKPPATKPAPAVAPADKKAAAKPGGVDGKPAAAAASAVSADAGYANRVRQHLAKFAGALPPGASGEARVQFVVQPDGRVTDVHLVKVSGNAGLDGVALSLPGRAQPLPLPGTVPQRLEVPVQAVAATP